MSGSGLLRVSELFYSIQGESTRAGLPCVFIRLCGCNLRCSYCDSRYTWDEEGRLMSAAEVCAELEQYLGIMAEITGGEPLLQEAVYPLMDALLAQGREVLLETGGSLSIMRVPAAVGVILDLKCPDSGMMERNDWGNIGLLRQRKAAGSRDELKFVLCSEEDAAWAAQVVREHRLTELLPVLFSPVIDRLVPARLADFLLREQLPVRLQLQLHTQIWPGISRGV
ncbi:MAG: radical SAM protein [Candidatus Electronema sp. V4]|uniref:radical SAM protein n=1 Tax=Candidatus Electronema sp. V4 TaxID=3454756 RepID=UPI0040554575